MKENCMINLFDIYGKEFKINISGKEKLKTFEGSIIGFVSICGIFAFMFYQLLLIFSKDLVSVIYNETTTDTPVTNFTDVPMMFKIVDIVGKRIPAEGLYSYELYYLTYTVVKDSFNNSNSIVKYEPINLEPRELRKHFGENFLRDSFEKLNVEDYYCIPRGKYNLTIYGYFGDLINGFSQILVFINKCSNSTSKCLPEDVVQKKLNSVFLVFAHLGYQIDNFNNTKPNQLKVSTTALTLSYHLLKRWTVSFMPMTYESDYGFFMENRIQEIFFLMNDIFCDVDPVPANIINLNPQLGSLYIRNTESIGHHFRSYVKFSSVIASISGVIKIFMMIGQLINYMMTNNIVYKKVSNLIFSYEENSEAKFIRSRSFASNFKIPKEDVYKISTRLKNL